MGSNGTDVTKQRIEAMQHTLSRESLKAHLGDRMETRYCKRVPMEMAIWFIVGVGMFSSDSYRQVFRWLTPLGTSIPGSSTLTEVRKRVGFEVMKERYHAVVALLGTAKNGVGFYKGMRLMAVDGFTLDLFDSSNNRKEFGRPKNAKTYGPFPQARCVALCELGTHVIWWWALTHQHQHLRPKVLLRTDAMASIMETMVATGNDGANEKMDGFHDEVCTLRLAFSFQECCPRARRD